MTPENPRPEAKDEVDANAAPCKETDVIPKLAASTSGAEQTSDAPQWLQRLSAQPALRQPDQMLQDPHPPSEASNSTK